MIHFLSKYDEERVIFAIQEAECNTSGEIRVHLERSIGDTPVLDAAAETFHRLGMDKTDLRNGVLFFIVPHEHRFAVIGDKGINEVVPDHFWDEVRDILETHFRQGAHGDGLCQAIELVGKNLIHFFPYQKDDKNELPDEISFGK